MSNPKSERVSKWVSTENFCSNYDKINWHRDKDENISKEEDIDTPDRSIENVHKIYNK